MKRMKSNTVRIGKRIMAVMLSLMMVAGIFAGMKLDVRAAAREIKLTDYLDSEGVAWIYYDNITCEDIFSIRIPITGTASLIWKVGTESKSDFIASPGKYSLNEYSNYLEKGKSYKLSVKIMLTKLPSIDAYNIVFYFDENKQQEITNDRYSHTCNFEWVTTIDPTTGADGLEEYKCVYCGAVQESHSIPASVAAVKDFYGKVKDAPEKGTVTYESGKLYTISDYLLKKMSERSDVTVTVNFEYQNAKYELTFPAGTDYTPVLTDEETMYGYFGVAAKLGLTVVAK